MSGNNAPFPWTPSRNSQPGSDVIGKSLANVESGDWCQVLVSYRRTNGSRVIYTPDYFLIHVIYTPNSDDAITHEDQSTTYGGSSTAGNRRRNFRIDPGVCFQVPWNGQLSVIAGGDSNPSTCVCDILFIRGFTPRDLYAQREMAVAAQRDTMERAMYGDVHAMVQLQNPRYPVAPRMYAPPVVGHPQLVPSTWINIPSGTAIPFPDGAVQITSVPAPGPSVAAFGINIVALGNALSFNLASGIPANIGSLGQGNACTDGVSATWSPTADLQSVTIWSSIGG